ncbi:hypothetical protein SAMN05444354_101270 [Stigmatella aurantiaca]|uniref:Uncharacterized protein n=1 Tax=Stigmatella aurantiaca TaxID=41 RepID=A0A1H7G5T4_STIAU|nr:hypothetical protein [Stigmatella aurantiaca]SEK31820.1 hypothetical protein SAMN05444354_101270 [Stigmatella aurantiaca]
MSSQDSRADRLHALGLTPEQVQQVIHEHPDLISYGGFFENVKAGLRGFIETVMPKVAGFR